MKDLFKDRLKWGNGATFGLFWVESPKQKSVRLLCLQAVFCCFFLYCGFSYGLWKAVCLRGAGGTRGHLLMGWPSFSLSLFSPIFPFTIPSMACIYAWFSSLPAFFLSIAARSPQGYRNFWSLVQDMHHHPHPYSFVPYPCTGAKVSFVCFKRTALATVSWLLYWTENAVSEPLSTETRDQHWHLLNYVPLMIYMLQLGEHCRSISCFHLCCVIWNANESRILKGHNLNTLPFLLFRGMGIGFETIKMKFTLSFG